MTSSKTKTVLPLVFENNLRSDKKKQKNTLADHKCSDRKKQQKVSETLAKKVVHSPYKMRCVALLFSVTHSLKLICTILAF